MKDLTHAFPDLPTPLPVPVAASPLPALVAWVGRLPSLTVRHALPELIVRLTGLLGTPLDTETRYLMLRALKGAVLRVAQALPHASARSHGAADGGQVGLGQRLFDAMARNCIRLLQDLDRERFGGTEERAERRLWAVRNAFRFIGRAVLCAVDSGRPWQPGLWQALHDLYVYLVVRGGHGEPLVQGGERAFDAQQAYKRLVLVGLVAELVGTGCLDADVRSRLAAIADDARLAESEALVGEYDLILVEVSRDQPARIKSDRLQDPFRGWVLQAGSDLEVLLLSLDPFRMPERAAAA